MKTQEIETIEDFIWRRAKAMRLTRALEAHGYEDIELNVLLAVGNYIKSQEPKVFKEIVDAQLDFFLSAV